MNSKDELEMLLETKPLIDIYAQAMPREFDAVISKRVNPIDESFALDEYIKKQGECLDIETALLVVNYLEKCRRLK